MSLRDLAERVGALRQLASVRRLTLEDGPESGPALLFSTGGGLDFLVMAGRGLDVGTLNYQGVPLAWQSPGGLAGPGLWQPDRDDGQGFNRGFSGLLMTCGLDSIRQPRAGGVLHGSLPGTPARLTACGEDWDRDEPVLFCAGEVVQARYGGANLRLRRRIEAPIGGSVIRLTDIVENVGPSPQQHALLYHLNFGFPSIGPGSTVRVGDETLLGPLRFPDASVSQTPACRALPRGGDVTCRLITPKPEGELEIGITFATETLPFLQLWQDLRPRAGILAIEPCTSDRTPEGFSETETVLAPGETRSYRLELAIKGLAPSIF
ncbi:MAG: DUF4432 family protein [Devosia sp.]|uniref:DUF4432 family protein n=1 Tax=Devosia sp. 67-54 TaxID=1895754 RepID=UPI001AD52C4B|nr:DUF4432 family protein [Devosia sp. 67-54]MBN9306676.1 DUF4432 family protein [Devosia sp.]